MAQPQCKNGCWVPTTGLDPLEAQSLCACAEPSLNVSVTRLQYCSIGDHSGGIQGRTFLPWTTQCTKHVWLLSTNGSDVRGPLFQCQNPLSTGSWIHYSNICVICIVLPPPPQKKRSFQDRQRTHALTPPLIKRHEAGIVAHKPQRTTAVPCGGETTKLPQCLVCYIRLVSRQVQRQGSVQNPGGWGARA